MNYIEQIYQCHKKSFRAVMRTINITGWCIFSALLCYSALYSSKLMVINDGEVIFTYYLVGALFIAGFYGYLLSLIPFFGTFVTLLFMNTELAYCSIVYLVAILCFSLFSQYFWFNSIKKTLIACTVTMLLVGFTENLCITVLAADNYSFEGTIISLCVFFIRNVLVIFASGVFMYLYFTKLPDVFKLPFPIALAYTKGYQENYVLKRQLRKTKISVKITAIIIIVELILGFSVGIFMIVLFPDIKDMLAGSIRRGEFNTLLPELSELPENFTSQAFAEGVENMQYSFDSTALTFDIKMIILMLCVGVPMAAFANFYTKMTIGQPLGILSDFMNDYANAPDDDKLKYGKMVDGLHIRTKDEINVVYESMRATVHEIENYINRIEEESKLEADLEVAKKSSEAKSNFLSNMSHEIRTPINAVLGMNEMIIREASEEDIVEYAQNIKSAGNSLLSLVNDILDFSKIEAGKMEILPVQYNLGSLINDLINLISARASDKGLDLEVNVDEHIPANLIGDEIRIKQCVTNILTNAVKYTEKGSVTFNVSCEKVNDINIALKFQIIDTGMGIKEEDIAKLYSPFERIEEIRNRSIEGTGLGMSIVKQLLALMDTKLVVESEYGKGSDFSFAVKQQVVSWDEIGDFKEKYKEYISSQESYHQRFEAPDAEVLVVDDTEMNLTVFKSLLKQTKVKIDTAESGEKMLKMVVKKHYDVIFLDHRMPQMDGIEAYEIMKGLEDNLNKDTPVIALTANAVSGAREEYMKHGFTDYLSKPINGAVLEEMLEHYLPAEKILSVSIFNGDDNYKSGLSEDIPKDSFLLKLRDIDLDLAVNNCGSVETLEEVIFDFYSSIDAKSDAIENYLKEEDIRNYTVLVHALKSSARIIGANELSTMAAELEDLGNRANIDLIQEKTPALLEKYRSYKDCLEACQKNKDKLPFIDKAALDEAYSNIKELVEAFDFDSADAILKMLEEYQIPAEEAEKYNKLSKLIINVDREGILELL